MARSTYVVNAFEWGKLLKCHFKLKSCMKWAVGLKFNDSEKKVDPRGSSAFKMLFEEENQQEIGKWTEY